VAASASKLVPLPGENRVRNTHTHYITDLILDKKLTELCPVFNNNKHLHVHSKNNLENKVCTTTKIPPWLS
jgi:hypothetical protein